jgi:hypothetical protein
MLNMLDLLILIEAETTTKTEIIMAEADYYVQQLHRFLETKGGACELKYLCNNVPRPSKVNGKIRKLLKRHNNVFHLRQVKGEIGGENSCTVQVLPQGHHKFDEARLSLVCCTGLRIAAKTKTGQRNFKDYRVT